jgi:RNA polymerase sigma-70 factor (ECF subfamily)
MKAAAVIDDRRSEGDLLERCRLGDPEAFRALYDAHKDRVYSIAMHFFHGDEATAADVTQQVFVKVLRNVGQFRREAELATWLYRVTANACIDEQRKGRRLLPLAAAGGEAPLAVPGAADDQILRDEVGRQVKEAVAALSPKLRIAILMRYFDDRPYDEIAQALGCSPGTVASRLNRAHRALARALAHMRGAVP